MTTMKRMFSNLTGVVAAALGEIGGPRFREPIRLFNPFAVSPVFGQRPFGASWKRRRHSRHRPVRKLSARKAAHRAVVKRRRKRKLARNG